MQLSGCTAQDAGLGPQENLGVYWQSQKEMLLYKSGTKETKKLLQTPSVSPQCLETSEGREWHIAPSGALIFPHGSTREAACRTLTLFLAMLSFQFCFFLP